MKHCLNRLCAFVTILSLMTCSCSDRRSSHSYHAHIRKAGCLTVNRESIWFQSVSSRSGPIGNVSYGKTYGDILLLYNDFDRCLYQVSDSTIIVALDKVGRGPEEYVDIGAFTFIPESGEIVIFERASKALRFYQDGRMTRMIQLDFYVSALEAFTPNHVVLAKESPDYGEPAAIIDYNLLTGEEITLLTLREDQAYLLFDFSFRKYNGLMYFGITGQTIDVYSYGERLQKVASVDFSPNLLGKNYWKGDFDEQKERLLSKAIQSGKGQAAVGPCLFSISENRITFWYMNGSNTYWHNLPDLSLCEIDLDNDCVNLYQQVYIPNNEEAFQPIAVWDNSYISVKNDEQFSLIKISF